MTHGQAVKDAVDYFSQAGHIDYLIQTSHLWNEYNYKSLNINKNQILDFGFPRNDELYKEKNKTLDLFPDIKKNKIIMWLPTYRNHNGYKNKENTI